MAANNWILYETGKNECSVILSTCKNGETVEKTIISIKMSLLFEMWTNARKPHFGVIVGISAIAHNISPLPPSFSFNAENAQMCAHQWNTNESYVWIFTQNVSIFDSAWRQTHRVNESEQLKLSCNVHRTNWFARHYPNMVKKYNYTGYT